MPATVDLPVFVRDIVNQLAVDGATQSVWLVGSRANEGAREDSDWDLLVFSSREPSPSAACRHTDVDVIHLGPSGMFLLEGQPEGQLRSFENWHWEQDGADSARYVSYKYLPGKPLISDNIRRVPMCAKLVWSATPGLSADPGY